MYVTLEEARRTVWKRWRDLALRRKVRDYVGEIPRCLRHAPRAVLARQLATPNFECFCFAEAADKVGLRPICLEYTGDKFCTINPDKLLLGKMTFFHGRGRKGGDKTSSSKVIRLDEYDRKPFTEIRTVWGEGFIDFHHRLFVEALPEIDVSDCTEWLSTMGGKPELYWPKFLALLTCHGVLFDNFHAEGHEAEFTRDIIRPTVTTVEKHFGFKPLIVPLVPIANERKPYWSWYSERFEREV